MYAFCVFHLFFHLVRSSIVRIFDFVIGINSHFGLAGEEYSVHMCVWLKYIRHHCDNLFSRIWYTFSLWICIENEFLWFFVICSIVHEIWKTNINIIIYFVFYQHKKNHLELPWDEPTTGCAEFVKWKSDNSWMTISPWSKMDNLALSLLRRILDLDTAKRITVKQILEHKWCIVKAKNPGMYFFVFDQLNKIDN